MEEAFRRLTIADARLIDAMIDLDAASLPIHRLDPRTEALLRVGALIAMDAPGASYRGAVEAATRTGTTLEDLVGVIAAVAGAVGSARIVAAAPRIALAAGYDVEAALEASESTGAARPQVGEEPPDGLPAEA